MNKIAQLWRIAMHPRELRLALSGLGTRLGGDGAMGGLTDEETAALVRWTTDSGVSSFVEIGTLFGFTARAVAKGASARVVAVDNFCWNPFGFIFCPYIFCCFVIRIASYKAAFADCL